SFRAFYNQLPARAMVTAGGSFSRYNSPKPLETNTASFASVCSMTGIKRKWTKQDTRNLLVVGAFSVGIFSLLALIHGGAIVNGAILGLVMWGSVAVISLMQLATGKFR